MSAPPPERAPDAQGRRFCVLAARWHEAVVRRLVDAACATLARLGAAEADVVVRWVPGSFELPVAAK